MIRTKLKVLLAREKISVYKLARAIKASGLRAESWAYRTVRGDLKVTSEGLEIIIKVICQLKGKTVTIADILEYQPDPRVAAVNGSKRRLEVIHLPPARRRRGKDLLTNEEDLWELLLTLLDKEIPYAGFAAPLPKFNVGIPRSGFMWQPLQQALPWLLVVALIGSGYWGVKKQQALLAHEAERQHEKTLAIVPAPAPAALGPEGIIEDTMPVLQVTAIEGVHNYRFSITEQSSQQEVWRQVTSEPLLAVPAGVLCAQVRYVWEARAFRGGEWSGASLPRVFWADSLADIVIAPFAENADVLPKPCEDLK